MSDQLERNKRTAQAFYDLMFNQSLPAEAVDRFVGATCTQHNPVVADGKEAVIEFRADGAGVSGQARRVSSRAGGRAIRRPSLLPALAKGRRKQHLACGSSTVHIGPICKLLTVSRLWAS